VRERLFAVDILFAPRRLRGNDLMPVVGDRDHNGIDIVASQQLTVIVVPLAVFIPVRFINLLDGCLQVMGIDIARGNHLAVWQSQECRRVAGPLPTHSDNAQIDAIVG
jgi:hypothetical protein